MLAGAQVDFASARLGSLKFRFAIPLTQMAYDPKTNTSFVQYCMVVQVQGLPPASQGRWMVRRRTDHFTSLHKLVTRVLEAKGTNYRPFLRPLPRRRYFESSAAATILSARRKRLKEYLQDVLALAEVDGDVCALACAFLDIDEEAVLGGTQPWRAQEDTFEASGPETSTHARHEAHDEFDVMVDKRSRIDAVVDMVRKPMRRGWLRLQKRPDAEEDPDAAQMRGSDDEEGDDETQAALADALESKSPSVSANLALKAGFLTKRGGLHGGSKSWKRRYFRLLPMGLSYYSASTMTLLGVIRVGDAFTRVVSMNAEQTRLVRVPSNQFGFLVSTEDRELVLCANSCQERDAWMQAIQSAVAAYESGSGTAEGAGLACEEAEDDWYGSRSQTPFLGAGTGHVGSCSRETSMMGPVASRLQHVASQEQDVVEMNVNVDDDGDCIGEQEAGPDADGPTAATQVQANVDEGEKEVKRRLRRHHSSSASSIKYDPFDASRDKGKIRREEDSFNAPDLQRKDAWEVDWAQLDLHQKVGEGAAGQVFRGSLWGSEVAVKKMHCNELTPGMLRSLRKEVTILSQLRHPCVVLYIGACTQLPNVCIITEWCSRGSLFDVLHSSSLLLDTKRRLDLALQVAKGMSYLHGRPKEIIHRDLKSMNVLVTQAWQAKVADFGLTIVRRKSDIENEDGGHFGIQGTPQWMAPEVMEGNRYNGKVDVYSFGIVLTEIFTRKMPFADRYKRFDFVDAVLEGATPTIPVWASDTTCLDEFEEGDDEKCDEDSQNIVAVKPAQRTASQRHRQLRRRSLLFSEATATLRSKSPPIVHDMRPASLQTVSNGTADSESVLGDDTEQPMRTNEDGDSIDHKKEEEEEEEEEMEEDGLEDQEDHREQVGTMTAQRVLVMRKREGAMARSSWESEDEDARQRHGEADIPLTLGTSNEARGPANIQRLTLKCLSRDPRSRPNFEEIVRRLSLLAENSSDELLEHFDLPRVHEMLEVGSLFDVSLAAREVTKIAHHVHIRSPFLLSGDERDTADDADEFSSLSSMKTGTAKVLLLTWVCPLVVRLVDRLTRETDFILTRGGERVQVHIPERILAELASAIYNLLQVCSGDEGVTMQAANVLADQGPLPVLARLFMFADAAQEFDHIDVQPSAYDQEAEIQHIVKNRNPDFGSLMHAGLVLAYLGLAAQETRVADAVARAVSAQMHSLDEASHLASRARSRCQSVGIMIGTGGLISFEAVRGGPTLPSVPQFGPSIQELREENLKMKRELASLRRKLELLTTSDNSVK
ncbi:Protein kinase, putative [Hondaea fermentalgiana]|uniref:Protein kinase, putative n=1 Tax=Hondaea fermentalgiana TaxID=2315210 RepID=A0A2R5GV74_9STRA|nr:Protein kinase, putative [Hondaea fermentalgiana]|eukprot:GBG34747.1 Protein kinase, putative [Hondaea fermentalgiana]